MAWEKAGTVNISEGSHTVKGNGTLFAAKSRVGDGFIDHNGTLYEIENIVSDTMLRLATPYLGDSVEFGNYVIIPVRGYQKISADRLYKVTEVIQEVHDIVMGLPEWLKEEDPVPVGAGGTGARDAASARKNLGLGSISIRDAGILVGQVERISEGVEKIDTVINEYEVEHKDAFGNVINVETVTEEIHTVVTDLDEFKENLSYVLPEEYQNGPEKPVKYLTVLGKVQLAANDNYLAMREIGGEWAELLHDKNLLQELEDYEEGYAPSGKAVEERLDLKIDKANIIQDLALEWEGKEQEAVPSQHATNKALDLKIDKANIIQDLALEWEGKEQEAVPSQHATNKALDKKADKDIKIQTGTGLSGGGDLTEDRTLSVNYGLVAGTALEGHALVNEEGDSQVKVMSQKTVTDALATKFEKNKVSSNLGEGEDTVVTQARITSEIVELQGRLAKLSASVASLAGASSQFGCTNEQQIPKVSESWGDLCWQTTNENTDPDVIEADFSEIRLKASGVYTLSMDIAATKVTTGTIFIDFKFLLDGSEVKSTSEQVTLKGGDVTYIPLVTILQVDAPATLTIQIRLQNNANVVINHYNAVITLSQVGKNVDLEGYATEAWVNSKGYLTTVGGKLEIASGGTGAGDREQALENLTQPSISKQASFNELTNAIRLDGMKGALALEIGDVIQLKTDNGYNKLHTVEQFIEQDFNVEGSFDAGRNDCPNMVWTGFASFDDKMTGVIASGYNKKLYKLVGANWVEWEESTQRLWTGLTKMNGVIYGCVFGGGIFKINPDGTDEQLTLTNRNWDTIYSKDGVMYAAIYGLRVYQIDIEDPDEEERDSIDNILTNVNRNNYSGIYVEGDYLYYSYDGALIWRKDLTSEDNEVAVSDSNNWKSNFVEYEGEVYIFGMYGLTYQLVGNEFITLETKLITTTIYVWGAAVIDGHLLVGAGSNNRANNRAETYLRIPYKQGEVILNYEHAGNRGNGSLKLPDFTGQATVTRIAKWFNAPIGLGQAAVSLGSAIRTHNTTYTNSTNRTIFVWSRGSTNGGQVMKVNGISRAEVGYGSSWTGVIPSPILPGESYIETVGFVSQWTEIR